MTPNQFLEILVSVSLQATLYVALCHWLSRWTTSDCVRSRIWTNCHLGLLGLAVIGASLPHLRLWRVKERFEPTEILDVIQEQVWWGNLLFGIWLTGVLLSFIWMGISSIRTLWFLRSLQPLADRQQSLPASWPNDPELQKLQICVSDRIASPFCWQFQRPVLVIPPQLLELKDQELQPILRHELAHLQANHPTHLFLQRIVQAVFWFHPAVYWAAHQTDLAREMMCDTIAARDREQIGDYLRVMLKLLEQPCRESSPGWALNFLWQRNLSTLARRARRLAERGTQKAAGPARDWLPAAMLLLVTIVTTAWLPVNALSSHRSCWSACPQWTAEILHDFGINARDYEIYDGRLNVLDRMHETPGSPD